MRTHRWSCLLALCCLPAGPAVAQRPSLAAAASTIPERGLLLRKPHRAGGYYQYLPLRPATGVLVVAHGRPIGAEEIGDIPAYVERFARRWVDFAEQEHLALVVPIFDEVHFGSVTARMSNLGALSGLPIPADVYVDEIIARTRPAVARGWDGRALLYGHLVGARFAASYAVRHPERVRGLVLTASGHYPMPDPDLAWPNGMMAVKLPLEWAAGPETPHLDARPDPAGWGRMATGVPATIIVGDEDQATYAPTPGHDGQGRVERARQWVAAMNRVANDLGQSGRAAVVTIPGPGQDIDQLTDAAAAAFRKMPGR